MLFKFHVANIKFLISGYYLTSFAGLVLMCTLCTAFAQTESPFNFEKLEKEIKQSTYFDSVGVFEKGKLAIAIATEEQNYSKIGRIYQYYGNFNYYLGRLEVADLYYDSSMLYAHQAKDSSLIVTNLVRKTYLELQEDTYAAERKFKKYLNVAKEQNDLVNVFETNNALGILSEQRQERAAALEYYYEALRAAENNNDAYSQGIALNNLGLLKVRIQQYEDAIKDFERGIQLADSIDEIRLAFNLHNNVGLLHYSEGANDLALTHYKETLERARRLGFPYSLLIAYLNVANTLFLNENFSTAEKYADSALYLMTEMNDSTNFPSLQYILAESRLNQDKKEEALLFINEGVEYAKRAKDSYNLQTGYNLQQRTLESLGRYEEALRTNKLYHTLKDSLNAVNNKTRLAELQIAYDTEKREAELMEERSKIELLKADNQLKTSRITLQWVIFVVVLIVFGLLFYLRIVRNKREQQKYFSQEILRALDEERSRISRDLHDDIGQSLSAVKSKVNLIKAGRLPSFEGVEESIGQILEQTRKISHEIHPSYLSKIGLKNSIISLLENVEKNTEMITSNELNEEIDKLCQEKQTQIYRILQECVANTIKHADAKSIKVSIVKEKDRFKLIYRDNGKGINNKKQFSDGIGMLTISERADFLNAKVQVGTNKNGGVRLLLSFPSE